jgi:hypothetical protein
MVVQHTLPDQRGVGSAVNSGRPDRSVRAPATGTLCRHCQYNPASSRIFGFCSWDCHDAEDDGGDAEGDKAA